MNNSIFSFLAQHLRRPPRLLMALVAALFLGLCAYYGWRAWGSSLQQDDTWTRIQHDALLRVGTDASYPPFELVDEQGEYAGYDIDLAYYLADRWSVEVQFVNISFDGLYDALLAGKCDLIISALPYDRTKTRDVGYSQTYFDAGQVLVASSEDTSIQGVEDLNGKRVAVELGAEGHQLARQLARDKGLNIEVEPLQETLEVFEALRAGEADALIVDKVTALQYQGSGYPIRLVGEPLTSDPYVIAVPEEAPLTLEAVDEALTEWRTDGVLDDLTQHWFGGQ